MYRHLLVLFVLQMAWFAHGRPRQPPQGLASAATVATLDPLALAQAAPAPAPAPPSPGAAGEPEPFLSPSAAAQPQPTDAISAARLRGVSRVLLTMDQAMRTADAAVRDFTDAGSVADALAALLQTMASGAQAAAAEQDPVSDGDADTLLQTTMPRAVADASALAADMVARRAAFELSGSCAMGQQAATAVRAGSGAMFGAVAARIRAPQQQQQAAALAASADAAMASAEQAFAGGACQNSGMGADPVEAPRPVTTPAPDPAPDRAPATPVAGGGLRTVTPAPGATPSPIFIALGDTNSTALQQVGAAGGGAAAPDGQDDSSSGAAGRRGGGMVTATGLALVAGAAALVVAAATVLV